MQLTALHITATSLARFSAVGNSRWSLVFPTLQGRNLFLPLLFCHFASRSDLSQYHLGHFMEPSPAKGAPSLRPLRTLGGRTPQKRHPHQAAGSTVPGAPGTGKQRRPGGHPGGTATKALACRHLCRFRRRPEQCRAQAAPRPRGRRRRPPLYRDARAPRVSLYCARGMAGVGPTDGNALGAATAGISPEPKDLPEPIPSTGVGRQYVVAALCAVLLAIIGVVALRYATTARPHIIVEKQLTSNPEEAPITGAVVSPDGKYVAYSDSTGTYFRQIDTGEIHPLLCTQGDDRDSHQLVSRQYPSPFERASGRLRSRTNVTPAVHRRFSRQNRQGFHSRWFPADRGRRRNPRCGLSRREHVHILSRRRWISATPALVSRNEGADIQKFRCPLPNTPSSRKFPGRHMASASHMSGRNAPTGNSGRLKPWM